MEEQKHSPLPWEYYGPTPTSPSAIGVSACKGQVNIYSAPLTTETDANARLIERACNSHYELVEAVKRLVAKAEAEYGPCLKNEPENCDVCYARAAIAKATGGAK